ncbi:ABC transporter ATP-binding protein [Parashewanella spongiae]|uniref:ABC transporter ATP-binding protein n=1 Tax=Parashewanella spongiae TaxID=342950 RepID=A0A3A6TZH9_9GAMM|nr:ABC transporter ATP-binding protein [Parashewanella spongiae]MCL1078501.1 ABC transporter ATP-binding protein [Parashewanella spongiae]RJY14706.1 ABC transporter ATP-binding protein [Parashewanella spongiae]
MDCLTPVLKFSQVSKAYAGVKGKAPIIALDKLELTLYPGMVVGLLGQNGAGKSTLMRCALGITIFDDGDISILGESPQTLSAAAKQCIGYVQQQPVGYEGFTVDKALDLHGSFYTNWDHDLQQQWLQRFELDGRQAVQKLSVGQRQTLALIMGMAYRPKLLILDEPVSSLDPIARRKFMADLFELALESGSAVLFSSHITSDIERVASHVALLKNGKLVLFEEIDALREQVTLVTLAEHSELPSYVHRLAGCEQRWLINNTQPQQLLSGIVSEQKLNLENLFVELHR